MKKNKGFDQVSKPWVQRSGEMFMVACCDCELVHDVTITKIANDEKHLLVQYQLNPKATKRNRKA